MSEKTLKPGWKIWRFDQMAISVTDRIDNPAEADVDHYVGLEHLDTDSLKISRWGVPTDVEATKLRFRKGDIIFGRRRVYQRKVGVAEFDGICSAHALVLRPKTDVILPEFLPFFMQSNLFMNRAIEISVGSLSPTINWKTLASQEFAIPPIEEQRRVAEVLLQTDEVLETLSTLANTTIILTDSLVEDMLSPVLSNGQCKLADCSEVCYGLTVNPVRRDALQKIPYLRVANVQRGAIDLTELKQIGFIEGDEEYLLKDADVLIVEGHANPQEVGRSVLWNSQIEKCAHQNHLIRVRCNRELNPEFLVIYLNSTLGRSYFIKHAKSTSGLNTINSRVVRELPIPKIELDQQHDLVESVERISSQHHAIKSRYAVIRDIKSRLLMELS